MKIKRSIFYYNCMVFLTLLFLWGLDSSISCMVTGNYCIFNGIVGYRLFESFIIVILFFSQFLFFDKEFYKNEI